MRRALVFKLLGGGAVIGVLGWFAAVHMDQAVDLRFGLFTLRDVPLPVVIYATLVVGMLAIVAVGLRADLRSRTALKRYDKIAADVLGDIEDDDEDALEKVERRA